MSSRHDGLTFGISTFHHVWCLPVHSYGVFVIFRFFFKMYTLWIKITSFVFQLFMQCIRERYAIVSVIYLQMRIVLCLFLLSTQVLIIWITREPDTRQFKNTVIYKYMVLFFWSTFQSVLKTSLLARSYKVGN